VERGVLISGASGLIGTALAYALRQKGYLVHTLVRYHPEVENKIYWDPESGNIDLNDLSDYEWVINFAGESIDSRWNQKKKNRIWSSRVKSTKLLASLIRNSACPPTTFLSASAIGYYGNQGDSLLDESSAAGTGFLSDLCLHWEKEAFSADDVCRVICPRIGMVLDPHGGALRKMLPAFKLGIGGKFGSGNQYISWIELGDLVALLIFCLEHGTLKGVVNACSPIAVTNQDFTRALANTISRPAFLSLPSPLLRLVFGEMAKELLLASARVQPKKILEAGFLFKYTNIREVFDRFCRPSGSARIGLSQTSSITLAL